MISKFDYNSEEVMKILNNPDMDDATKKQYFEKYKNDLKLARKKEIVRRVNELAQNNPIITEEIYVDFLKKYEDDNLSKPFAQIEKEIKEFDNDMSNKYNEYLENKRKEEEQQQIVEEPKEDLEETKNVFEDEIVPDKQITAEIELPKEEESIEPSLVLGENSVLNEEPEILAKPLFEDNEEKKEVMPNTIPEVKGEKGNASAIIISIIAIIVGVVVMYTIIKMS